MPVLDERDYFTDRSVLLDPYDYFEEIRAHGPIVQLENRDILTRVALLQRARELGRVVLRLHTRQNQTVPITQVAVLVLMDTRHEKRVEPFAALEVLLHRHTIHIRGVVHRGAVLESQLVHVAATHGRHDRSTR